ncbi:hypothetical protein GCM10010269_80930 [Streptomyces humidus]|uniref:Uncharacterized protein n=1 Tax=Streptomyces humidus TaxID=52259 RepID=A0A918LC79_9ACTN|nr:hypothetical protein [Streptomyces humidus]GGS30113.1 hypothetical protein GCM10010269_80930 [Streptomyces humidus]
MRRGVRQLTAACGPPGAALSSPLTELTAVHPYDEPLHALLIEANEAADRYGVVDVRAFALLLRARIALDRGELARARVLCDETRAAVGQSTPPPRVEALAGVLDAHLTAAEFRPESGLPMLADTLRQAVADHCAEAVTTAIVDSAAFLLAEIGDFARAARLLAAADGLRGPHPRPAPQRAWAERAEAAAREALGPRPVPGRLRGAALRGRARRGLATDGGGRPARTRGSVRAPAPPRPRAATSS